MGSSGAGKTSLLNALSDRITLKQGCKLDGRIMVNDKPMTQKVFGKIGSYVMQDDILFAYFTVREALTFAARLRLPLSVQEQDRKIDELIVDLGLQKCKNTVCGS